MIAALTGFMASGKTTFGRAAAQRLGFRFIDLDKVIEDRYGSISEIFEGHGEDFFRDMESRCLKEMLASDGDCVIALGGGTILSQSNCRLLKARARLIWLDTSLEIIMSELYNADRPLVRDKTPQQIEDMYEKRKSLYREISDVCVKIDSTDYSIAVDNLCDAILKLKG